MGSGDWCTIILPTPGWIVPIPVTIFFLLFSESLATLFSIISIKSSFTTQQQFIIFLSRELISIYLKNICRYTYINYTLIINKQRDTWKIFHSARDNYYKNHLFTWRLCTLMRAINDKESSEYQSRSLLLRINSGITLETV